MTEIDHCPCCGEQGHKMPELSDRLRACLSVKCRVNEFMIVENDV